MNLKYVVFDIEADGLSPTKVYCLSYKDQDGQKGTLTDYGEIRDFFSRYDVYAAHNGRRFDLPNLRRLCGIPDPARFVDTLGLAWYLDPGRKKNGLEAYGEDYGVPKPKILDWENLPLEDYIHRCEEDVEINYRLFEDQLRYLVKLYPDWGDLWDFVSYIDFKLKCAVLQEESRWKLDEERCRQELERLEIERDRKLEELQRAMPPVPIVRTIQRPKRYRNADGQLSVLGQRWADRLVERGLPEDYDGTLEEITGHDDPNPGSHVQIKDWLYSLGWVPQTIKYVRNKATGEIKEIPQINKEHGGGICESIQKLYDKEPNLELLDGLSVLNHRISMLAGFLRDADNGWLSARMAGFTNTLRLKHAELVNLPKPEKPYGDIIRGVLVAPDDHELCGSDMSGLEDRLKQHFLYDYDPEYVDQLNRDDYDPHIDIGVLAGGISERDGLDYVAGIPEVVKRIKPLRSIFKNGNYACQYGAGASRIALTCGISAEDAKKLHEAYWKKNWAIRAVAKDQEVIELPSYDGEGTQLWLRNPINGFFYSLRTEKDIFSTLVQGSASYCFDVWVGFILNEREQLTGQFHDEIVLTVLKGYREDIKKFLKDCIKKTNEFLGLNRELDIDIQFGGTYADIH